MFRRINPLLVFFVCFFILLVHTIPSWAESPEQLRVLTMHPSGNVQRVKQFTVTFNQPMIALGEMAQDKASSPLVIKPSLKGQYRWLNVYTLVFEPSKPLEGSFQGQMTVKAGTRSLSGAVLQQPVKSVFKLPSITLLRTYPRPKSKGLSLKPEIRLSFNQPIDIESLKSKAYFLTEKGRKYRCSVIEDTRANARRRVGGYWNAIVSPLKNMTPNTGFDLIIGRGLKSSTGPIPSAKAFRTPFRTYGPLKIVEITGYRMRKDSPFDPESGINVKFTNPVSRKEIMRNLKISPEYNMERLEVEEEFDEATTYFWIPGPFKPETTYTLAFGSALKDEYGQNLQGRKNWSIPLGPARPVLELPGRQGVLEPGTDPTYPFRVRNVKKISARGYFLNPEKIIPFIMKHQLYSYMYESREDVLEFASPLDVKTAEIDVKIPPNVMTWQPVRLNDIFGKNTGPGLMYFDLNAPETNNYKDKSPIYRRALVQVSNLGLSVKFGMTNTLIWTTDLSTGAPLSNARLEIRNKENHILWRGKSNKEGLAAAPGAAALKIIRDSGGYGEPSLFVMGRHGENFSIVSTEWNQGIQPWSFGFQTRDLNSGPELMTWVLTALPLYKPGDEVSFKIIQRLNGPSGLTSPKKKKIYLVIKNSRNKAIEKFTLELSRYGTASAKFKLPANASLGSYTIQVGTKQDNVRYAGSFRVETYRKPTFAVDVKPSRDSAFAGEKISANMEARYHFGSPVKNRPLYYSVTSSPAAFTLKGFENYTIEDWISDPEEPDDINPVVAEGELKLDDKGTANINFLAAQAKRPQPRQLQIEATVTDVDQRTVSNRKSVTVHPASFYIGLKTDKYLAGQNEDLEVKIITATPESEPVSGIDTELSLYRRTWQTVRRKGVGGYYHYVSKATDDLVESFKVTTGNQPKELKFSVEKGGYYYLAANAADSSGRPVSSSVDFYIYGSGAAGWEHYDHDRIDLVLDKNEYKPGETATIMVKSPFSSGTGLMTIERNGVRRYTIFPIENSSPSLKVDLRPEDSPNVYVSVLLVRGRISDKLDRQGKDPGKPAFKVGYAEISVANDHNRLKVEVEPDRPKAGPGEEVELNIRVRDSEGKNQKSELAVIVADAALLQLSSENVYYPERLFFSPRDLAVITADIRLNLIGRRHYGLKGANPGGGGFGPGESKFRRKFVSLAYFEPHLITDDSGRAKVRFKLPENLTTFKIFVAANTDGDRFGTGVNSITVNKPLLIKPSLPNFVGIGDEFKAAVTVHNQSGDAGQAEVRLSGENFEIIGSGSTMVNLEPNSSMEVGFPVKIVPGKSAVFRYSVNMGQDSDAAEYKVPARYPNPILTAATYGRITKSIKQKFRPPAGSAPDRGALSMTVSPSMAGSLMDAFDYLADYPHLCLEQKTSRALGDLLMIYWHERLGKDKRQLDKARKRINTFLKDLPAYQTYKGGFKLWPSGRNAHPFVSGYVVQFMNLAGQNGFIVDKESYRRGKAYINDLLKNNRWPNWYGTRYIIASRAYLVNVLAEAGQVVDAYVENLYAGRNRLTPFGISLLLKTITIRDKGEYSKKQIDVLTKQLFGYAVFSSGEVHFEESRGIRGLMSSTARTNALALSALLQAAPNNPHLVPLARWLAKSRINGHWGNTQANAFVLLAMTDYLNIMEKTPPDFSINLVIDQQTRASASFNKFSDPPVETAIKMSELDADRKTPLSIQYQGQGAAYYSLKLKYAMAEPDLKPSRNGMTLSRKYTVVKPARDAQAGGSKFNRGDIVRVDITLLAPSRRNWVVLEDLIPAGLEPLNFNLPVAPSHLRKMLDTGARPAEYFQRYWYEHREIRRDRVIVYSRFLNEGVYTLSYLARAVVPGTYIAPGPYAEEMYSPEVSGQGAGQMFEIK